uniref:Uncharacterized protein n=1 Tax=Chromera velia CCMP2878 TaxID=1169474 RepID=A0A0G4I3V5_9ALVE|mmetsp:Transcript_55050/g.107672  ORF Transcript_55050/g.107672 Transcript_55050/m.107672 type:complete len:152 (-) Transcript_55050:257-712(-)|eukprot:Cvel_10717.t1-p1 / transcript=Cvel_10717.t1 / gene=Cvel_10717 / organism=Chromera_velia_CCMP2878 / gene_product=hypothetical protein / transcript_product=hypothetical protein / location=Cvel_scaffold652:35608-36060(-) / protein_length=151 / sequence_SO=supercontig / SO=protein_coding / is_pseudo=false
MGSIFSRVEDAIEDKIAQKAMMQREVQMSVNIAKARDTLMWFGGLYTFFIGAATGAAAAGKGHPLMLAPVILGGFGLSNLADMAYGTKLTRVVKEAEHILEHEKGRFVPMKQAMFDKYYGEEERKFHKGVQAVGFYWPSFLPMHRPKGPGS